MVFSSFKELRFPPSSTPAYFMSKNFGPGSCRYLQKWKNVTQTTYNYNGHYRECFNKNIHLGSILEIKCSQINQ